MSFKPKKPIITALDPPWFADVKRAITWLMEEVQRNKMTGDGATFSVTGNAGGAVGHASPAAIEIGIAELGGITVTQDGDSNYIAATVTIDDMAGDEIGAAETVRLFGKGLSTSVTFDANTDVMCIYDGTRWVAALAISDIATGYDAAKNQLTGHDAGDFVWNEIVVCVSS